MRHRDLFFGSIVTNPVPTCTGTVKPAGDDGLPRYICLECLTVATLTVPVEGHTQRVAWVQPGFRPRRGRRGK